MDLLNKLIADPTAIKNIKDMVGNMSVEQNNSEVTQENNSYNNQSDSLSFLYELLNNQQNSEMLKKINSAYSKYSNDTTPGLKLLDALKPFLNQRRIDGMDKIRKVIKISNAFSEFKK